MVFFKKRDLSCRSLEPRTKITQHQLLIEFSDILQPPLLIKLGPMLIFVKTMDQARPSLGTFPINAQESVLEK